MSEEPKEPSIKPAAIVSAAYVLGIVVLAFTIGGVFNDSSGRIQVRLALFLGGLVLWLLAGVAAILGLRCLFGGYEGFGAYTGSIVLLFGAPLAAYVLVAGVFHHLDRRAIDTLGVTELRKEAATLIEATNNFSVGFYPKLEELPPRMRKLAEPHRHAIVREEGVFIGTGRSGYFIAPPGSRYEPKGSRTIADGIYYDDNP